MSKHQKMTTTPKGLRSTTSLGYFNLARGLGMLFVVWGHSVRVFLPKVEQTPSLFSGVGAVFGGGVMAMFFLISGYGFYQRRPKKCVTIQAKLLLKPYCITACGVLLTKLALAVVEHRSFWRHGGEYLLTYLLGLNAEGGGQLAGIPVESIGIFWFVLALMNGWILYNGILRLRHSWVRWSLVGLCVVAGYALTLLSKVWPCCIHMSLVAVGYLAAGREIRQRNWLERPLPLWGYVGLMVPVGISLLAGQVDMITGTWRLGLLDVLGTLCLGFLLMRFFAWFANLGLDGWPLKVLETIGFNSIWIVCLHAYEKVIFPWYRLALWLPDHPVLGTCLCIAGRSLVIFGLYLVIVRIDRWWKGRKWRRRGKIVLEKTEGEM